MKIEVNDSGPTVIVMIDGEIEMTSLKIFKNTIIDIGETAEKDVEIDFTNVDYIDSSGMGVLLTLSKLLKENNRTLLITNCSDKIMRVFQLSSLHDML